jgi:hypothetical protein
MKKSIVINSWLDLAQRKYPQNKININRSTTDKIPSLLKSNNAERLDNQQSPEQRGTRNLSSV